MRNAQTIITAALLVVAASCGGDKPATESAAPPATAPAPLKIDRVEPNATAVNSSFNVDKDGKSEIAVFGTNIPGGSAVVWNDRSLDSKGGGTFVAAVVPAELLATPGVASVKIRTGAGVDSNAMEFTVYGKTGPAPKITQLYPGSTKPGKGFNVQPDGQSAIGVAGEGFLPDVTLMMDGKKLKTVFAKGTGISAIVPASLIASAGSHKIWAVNPDGKASAKVDFSVGN